MSKFYTSRVAGGRVTLGCILTNFSTLTTYFTQERELQNISENFIVVYKTLMNENRHIWKIITIFSHGRNSHTNSLSTDADFHFQNSLTEQTIHGRHSHGIPR